MAKSQVTYVQVVDWSSWDGGEAAVYIQRGTKPWRCYRRPAARFETLARIIMTEAIWRRWEVLPFTGDAVGWQATRFALDKPHIL